MKIGEILIHQNSITQEELDLALWIQKHWGGLLGRILVSRGFLPEAELVGALATQLGMPSVTLQGRCTPAGLCRLLPFEACISNLFLAFGQDPDSGTYLIAMADPRDTVALATLRASLTRPFRVHICGHLDLTEALFRLFLLLREPSSPRQPPAPRMHRALQEVIEADGLIEEVVFPERARGVPERAIAVPERAIAVVTAPIEAADDIEVLEESEMLAAMAAMTPVGRISGEVPVIVESGDFEIVSTEELAKETSITENSAAELSSGPQVSPPQNDGHVGDNLPKKDDEGPAGQSVIEKNDNVPTPRSTPETPSSTVKKAAPEPVRRGLMSALAGREPEKKSPEKKPPPSPFSSRDKK